MNEYEHPHGGTATFIRELSSFTGDARLYRVAPPMSTGPGDGHATDYVVVSATVVMSSGPETYIFAADEDGDVTDWAELDGSFRGALDHEAALRAAGYEIAEVNA